MISFFSLFFLLAANQTPTVSPVETINTLPFTIQIDEAPFSLPTGIQGFAGAQHRGRWILLAGRTNGLHGFENVGNNFPPSEQNLIVYVIDPKSGISYSRSLEEPSSGLTAEEVDTLSTVAPEVFQKGSTLYIVGGYGINRTTGEMETKSTLTALDLQKLTDWVIEGAPSVKSAMRQLSHPLLQVTGGFLYQQNNHTPFLLMVGQNFSGLYRGSSNGIYTHEIRSFWLNDQGNNFAILPNPTHTLFDDYRRRDLNILPVMKRNRPFYTIFSGVFTPSFGIWTVPITVDPHGGSSEGSLEGFKQAMNNYNCPSFGLYSVAREEMYGLFPGGISFGFFSGGSFMTDSNFPFINQVTAIRIDSEERYTQFLLENEYPAILSTGSNPGNPLLFGAEAQFFLNDGIPTFYNGVIRLDDLPSTPIVIGHIVGGIMSTLPNTNTSSDSTASPYVFQVTLLPR